MYTPMIKLHYELHITLKKIPKQRGVGNLIKYILIYVMSSSHFRVQLSLAKWSGSLIQNHENIMYASWLVKFR